MMLDKLLSPTTFGPWQLTNRVAMAPLTRSRAESDWTPSAQAPEYYSQRSSAGLVICEATQVSPDATGYPRTPGIWTDRHVARWTRVVDAIHAGGARAVLQLWHCGRVGHPDNQPEGCFPMGPSAVRPSLPIYTDQAGRPVENPMPREMTKSDIIGVIDAYRAACENAKAAGFDGVECHGANGYLVEQFASANTNLRDDAWGGDIDRRMRFLRKVLGAMSEVYPSACVGLRLSPYGRFNGIEDADPDEKYRAMLTVAEEVGIGYVHVIRPVVSGNVQMEASARDREVLETARSLYSGPIIAAAGFRPDTAEAELESGRADLIAFGRAFISNPDYVRRIREALPIAAGNEATFYTPGPAGYTDYPFAD